jgi:hypothetical protein
LAPRPDNAHRHAFTVSSTGTMPTRVVDVVVGKVVVGASELLDAGAVVVVIAEAGSGWARTP